MAELNFDEFKEKIKEGVKDYLPPKYEDADISFKTVAKNNGIELEGIIIKTEDENISPNIYLNSFYEHYKNGKDIDSIISDIADARIENDIEEKMDFTKLFDFEHIKDNIVCKLVNTEQNKDMLKDLPHTELEDLSAIYMVQVASSKTESASFTIDNLKMKIMGVDAETLHDTAIKNMENNSKPTIESMHDVVKNLLADEFMDSAENREEALKIAEQIMPDENMDFYVISNENKILGASAILDTATMDKVADKLDGDFYIIPSSVHECIAVQKDEDSDYRNIEAMVGEINDTVVDMEDMLSNHVYVYDSKEHEIYRADKENEHILNVAKKHIAENDTDVDSDKADRPKEKLSFKEKLSAMKEKAEKHNMSHDKKDKDKKAEMTL